MMDATAGPCDGMPTGPDDDALCMPCGDDGAGAEEGGEEEQGGEVHTGRWYAAGALPFLSAPALGEPATVRERHPCACDLAARASALSGCCNPPPHARLRTTPLARPREWATTRPRCRPRGC